MTDKPMKRVARFEKRPRQGIILMDWEDVPEDVLDDWVQGLLGGDPDSDRLAADGKARLLSRGSVMLQIVRPMHGSDPDRTIGHVIDGMTVRRRGPEDDN